MSFACRITPQSNGKLERSHHPLKEEAIRAKTPLSSANVKRVATGQSAESNVNTQPPL